MAKRRYETMVLNGKSFTYDNKLSYAPYETDCTYTDIWHAYDRPSYSKEKIWCDWIGWFYQNKGNCWIGSRNSFQFTITGYIINNETGEMLGVHITANKRVCWSICDK